MITYERAKIFSSGTEYEIFRNNYCDNDCIHHKEREDLFPELVMYGGCPIGDLLEYARFDSNMFPRVLLSVFNNETLVTSHYCPFFIQSES